MHEDAFQVPSSAMCAEVFNQIRRNVITEECILLSRAFEYIEQTVGSLHEPNDRNQALLMSIFRLILSGISSRNAAYTGSCGYFK
jgi:hypothetical protein